MNDGLNLLSEHTRVNPCELEHALSHTIREGQIHAVTVGTLTWISVQVCFLFVWVMTQKVDTGQSDCQRAEMSTEG